MQKHRADFLCYLDSYQFCIYNLCDPIFNIIYTTKPFYLIAFFELFGYTLLFCHLFYKQKKYFFCLLVNFSKITVQLTN